MQQGAEKQGQGTQAAAPTVAAPAQPAQPAMPVFYCVHCKKELVKGQPRLGCRCGMYHKNCANEVKKCPGCGAVFVQEAAKAAAERTHADKMSNCSICRGMIKPGLAMVKCTCGKHYHERCADRVGECVSCGKKF